MYTLRTMKRMQNPLATVREMAAHEPSRPALIYDDAVTTYGQLAAQACSVANGLIAAQMPPQSRIALLDFNDPTYPEILLGCHIAGHTLCPINARLAAAEVAWILDDSKAPNRVRRTRSLLDDRKHRVAVHACADHRAAWWTCAVAALREVARQSSRR